MKKPSFTKSLLAALLIFVFPSCLFSQTFLGVSSAPADNGAQAGPTVAVTPPGTMLAGDLVIVYAQYRATGATISISANGGQAWTTATTYSPAGLNQTIAIFWCRYNGTWGTNPSVTVGAGVNGLSAMMYVFRPSNSNSLWGVHISPANSNSGTNPNSITGVTTTASNTVTTAFWSAAAT